MLVGNKSDLEALRVIPAAEVAAEFASAFRSDPFSGFFSVAESSPAIVCFVQRKTA